MVAKSDILTAANQIEQALGTLTPNAAPTKAHVFETDWGHLKAIIGSEGFKDVSLGARQQIVWDFLREKVPKDALAHLIAVYPMGLAEYDRQVTYQ